MSQKARNVTLEATISYDWFREFIDAIDAVADEAKVRIGEDGISSRAVDPANVAMVEAQLPAEAFEEFNAEETAIGVTVRQISALLDHLENEGPVTLTLIEQSKKLVLEAGDFSYTYTYHSPDTIRKEPDLPELDLTAEVKIEGARLRNAVAYFRQFAERVTTGYSLDGEEFYMEGQEKKGTDDGEFRVHRSDLAYARRSDDASSVFHLDYFYDLAEALPDDGTVTMELGDEYPMTIAFGIAPVNGSGDRYHGDITFLQAPRIQSD